MRSRLSGLALFAALAAPGLALAQAPAPAGATLAQAERTATGLKQGMPLEDVRKLLGNPQRTATRSQGSNMSETTSSTLQWIYSWAGAGGNGTLRVNFSSRVPDAWKVTSWEWANP